jgi:hypothetical protein
VKAPCSLLLGSLLLGSLLLLGCTTAKTVVERPIFGTNGVVGIERTATTARTFADGKNRLADFKAGQTAKTQTIGIGEQTGESTSDVVGQLANGLMMLGRLAALTQGVPLPAPAPAPAPVPVIRTNAPAK